MGHSHDHTHHHNLDHHEHGHGGMVTSNIKVAFFLNISFTLLEIFGGIFFNSVAVLSDAIHDLGDSLSLGLAWYFQHLATKGRDEKYSYGYRRYSVVGALVNSAVLVTGSLFIAYEAIPRFAHPEQADAHGMLGFAILGIVVNGAAALRLRKGKSLNESAVAIHLLEDVLGWAAVLVASIVMLFADVPWLDPALSLAIMAWVVYNAIRNLGKAMRIFLQATPLGVNLKEVDQRVKSVEGVRGLHDLHVWTLDGNYHIMTVHLDVEDELSVVQTLPIREKVREILQNLGIEHITIEIEGESQNCGYEEGGKL